jgi:hypothetical protein
MPCLRDVFFLFLLGHREASHLTSHAILRDQWWRVLDHRQILHGNLDELNQGNQKGKGHEADKTILTRDSNPLLGRIGTLSTSSYLKTPTIHQARRMTSLRGRVSCDI